VGNFDEYPWGTSASGISTDAPQLSASLLRAADAAGRARDSWLHLARALNQVDTDTMRHLAPAGGEAGDLALCTGRLAYADATWTLSSGPGHQPRPPHELAPHPGDVPLALAAAHHACDAMTSLAYAQRERIRTAASAGRLLVPTRSLPDTMDIPRPYAPALSGHVHALLQLCQDTAEAAAEASAQAGQAATAIRAPSRLLTAGRSAADLNANGPRPTAPEPAVAGNPRGGAGAVEDILHRLGVTSPDLLQRAADIDQAGEQLIIEAAARAKDHEPVSHAAPGRSASSPAPIHDARTPGDPHAADRQPEPPEAEP
jgi:hypothetical protein